ncbi:MULTISPECIES: ABC transporter substrate-binding protein [unclassified Streptomyces]|uniref:ABC transporter substrate-binding protein n=1 Tax=unclassified Streptomyces TaxID=2593676 RepID=UPI00036D8253|nr:MULTISPECIES: ABC transporter substrate-binding protein [unclassified Streptomyces]MYQ79533.1 ABC transporter substrate-binding protein [Streptomyces sp. SID4923]NEC04545.1 ABC transporter substrate-binding protein [Streptomyces sp. SID7909]OKI93353.1 ABC transporter substrate-binding protein [Streptomyces sp. CB01249]
MSIRRSSGLVGAVALALVLAGCGSSSDGGSDSASEKTKTRVFTADNGKITIPANPKRVVATGYAVPALIEADAPLVGISSWKRGEPMMTKDDLATYKKLKKIAGEQATETNYEAIAEAEPDLIVIGVPAPVLGDIDMKRLKSIAPVVAIGPSLPSAWRDLSRKQADAAGASKQFDAQKKTYDDKAAELAAKYKDVLPKLKLGHVGAYGDAAKGTFQREFNGSWGTNIAEDLGATYYGKVKKAGPGSAAVSEYPSIEELPAAFREADVLTYSVNADGSVPPSVQYVLDSKLWKNLPAVKAGKAFPYRYTEAATYGEGLLTLDAIDKSLAPLLKP